jgi:hypothetical protein
MRGWPADIRLVRALIERDESVKDVGRGAVIVVGTGAAGGKMG